MNRIIFVTFLISIFFSACQKDNHSIKESYIPVDEDMAQETLYYPGVIRVRVDQSLADKIEGARDENGDIGPLQVKSVDDLLLSAGVTSITRTFPHAGRFEERTRKAGLHLWYDVEFDTNTPLTKAKSDFVSLPGIEEVELDMKIVRVDNNPIQFVSSLSQYLSSASPSALEMPFDDPRLKDQWHYYNNGGSSVLVEGADINVFPVWNNYTTGSDAVIVSIVDGGIDLEHEDLIDNLWINFTEFSGKRSIDDDGNGYVDDIYGFNFVTGNGTISPHNHGTHVAGTVGAVNNNGKGVSGVAGGDFKNGIKGVRLMSCQIFSSRPEDEEKRANTAAAIKYGADNGAVISQNSWGYEEVIPLPSSIKAVIDYFIDNAGIDEFGVQEGPMKGGIVIFAAGNENSQESTLATYERVLSVAALAPDYVRAVYSNYGDWVDISAPGGQSDKSMVLSTTSNNSYGAYQGTSMACPHVSGVAALVIANSGGAGFTNTMLWDRLVESTSDIYKYNVGYGGKLGSGMVDALGAITWGGTTPPDPVSEITGTVSSNNISIKWKVPADEDDIKAYGFTVYYSTNNLENLDISNMTGVNKINVETGSLDVGDFIDVTIVGLEFDTEYFFRVDAYDYSSNRSALSPQFQIASGANLPPVITPLDGLSANLKAFEVKYLNFSFSDPDDHQMRWSVTGGSEAVTSSLIRDDIQVRITGKNAPAGTYSGVVEVTDEFGAQAELDFTYTIEENRPPTLINNPEDLYLGSLGEEVIIDLSQIFHDPDGEKLSYIISSTVPSVAHLNPNPNNNLLYVTSLQYGFTEITLTAKDVLQESTTAKFNILVRDGNNEIDLFPNPVIDVLNLRTGELVNADISIISSIGATVYTSTSQIGPFDPLRIDMSTLSGGTYTILIKYNGKDIIRNITKL